MVSEEFAVRRCNKKRKLVFRRSVHAALDTLSLRLELAEGPTELAAMLLAEGPIAAVTCSGTLNGLRFIFLQSSPHLCVRKNLAIPSRPRLVRPNRRRCSGTLFKISAKR